MFSTDVCKFIDSSVAAVWDIQPLFVLRAAQTRLDVGWERSKDNSRAMFSDVTFTLC